MLVWAVQHRRYGYWMGLHYLQLVMVDEFSGSSSFIDMVLFGWAVQHGIVGDSKCLRYLNSGIYHAFNSIQNFQTPD